MRCIFEMTCLVLNGLFVDIYFPSKRPSVSQQIDMIWFDTQFDCAICFVCYIMKILTMHDDLFSKRGLCCNTQAFRFESCAILQAKKFSFHLENKKILYRWDYSIVCSRRVKGSVKGNFGIRFDLPNGVNKKLRCEEKFLWYFPLKM